MSQYKLTKAEMETIINYDEELSTASIYTHDQRMIKKLRDLAEKYPGQFVLERKGPNRAVTYRIPKRCVSIRPPYSEARMSFLIDIQEKMQEGKGAGYARWAKVFNLKQMAQAMMFMQEHGIQSYEELAEKAGSIAAHCDSLLASVKEDEARLQEIAVLKTHIINYAKAKDTFAEYKKSGYSQKYFEEHREVLTLRRAAKQAFDAYKKEHGNDAPIPRVKDLNAEYALVLERKKKTYSEYRKTRSEMQDWLVAQRIVQTIIGEADIQKEHEKEQQQQAEQKNR